MEDRLLDTSRRQLPVITITTAEWRLTYCTKQVTSRIISHCFVTNTTRETSSDTTNGIS